MCCYSTAVRKQDHLTRPLPTFVLRPSSSPPLPILTTCALLPDLRLLKSQHVVWQEQACTTLTTLLEDRMARRQAGESGAAVALADLIRGPYTPNSLVRVATVAIARLCSDNSSQVLVLEAGGLMPLAEMLSHEEEQRWYAAAEALAMCSSNDTNKRLLGDAGTVTAVLRRLHNDSPRAIQARVLAVAIRLICDQRNLDIAVEGGILPRLTVMSGDRADALILQYISLALQTLSRAVRHLPVLLQEGLIECIRAILLRVTEDGEFVSTPEAATVRSSLSDVLLSLSRVDGLRSSLVERGALPLAVGLMKCPENTVMADSCTVVALIAANKDEWKDAAREAGCIQQVSRLVCSKNMQVRLEAAAAVRALATNIVNKRELVEAGALHGEPPSLPSPLSSPPLHLPPDSSSSPFIPMTKLSQGSVISWTYPTGRPRPGRARPCTGSRTIRSTLLTCRARGRCAL
jgi:hypothetical protein